MQWHFIKSFTFALLACLAVPDYLLIPLCVCVAYIYICADLCEVHTAEVKAEAVTVFPWKPRQVKSVLLEVKMRKSFLPSQVSVRARVRAHTRTHTHIHAFPGLSAHAQANTHLSCCSWLWKGQVVRCRQDQSSRCQRTCPNAYRLHMMAHKSLWEGRYRREWAVIHDKNSLTIEAIRIFPQQRQPSILFTKKKKKWGGKSQKEKYYYFRNS